jgi:cytochrome d ubiquinol oxidase subunit II
LLAVGAAVYGVLDGYDLGVGILYPFMGNPEHRSLARETILPVWDGNQVWLIAGGALLFLAFPAAYAAAFGGFYLAFFVLLWLLILRGLSLEMHGHAEDEQWHTFCDIFFFFASTLLAFVYGVALTNVLRGVPLDEKGFFFVPFWTNMRAGRNPGVFDWYTLLGGATGVAVLIVHAGAFLAGKTLGPVRHRALKAARGFAIPMLLLVLASLLVTPVANRTILAHFEHHPAKYLFPIGAGVAAIVAVWTAWTRRERATFAATTVLIVLLVGTAAIALYPTLMIATTDRAYDLTIQNSAASHHGLVVGFIWAVAGLTAVASYSAYAHSRFSGRHGAEQ